MSISSASTLYCVGSGAQLTTCVLRCEGKPEHRAVSLADREKDPLGRWSCAASGVAVMCLPQTNGVQHYTTTGSTCTWDLGLVLEYIVHNWYYRTHSVWYHVLCRNTVLGVLQYPSIGVPKNDAVLRVL